METMEKKGISPSEILFQTVEVTHTTHRIRTDARLTSFTTSNDPLPSNLHPVLSDHLSSFSNGILDLDKQHHLLQSLLVETQKSRNLLVAERARWESLIGIRSLPVEILTQIFHQTLEAKCHAVEPHQIAAIDPFQMNDLRLVCKRWDEAAVSEPTLWRNFQLDLDVWKTGSNTSLMDFVDRWIARGGEGCAGFGLALIGSGEAGIRAGEVAGDSQPILELMKILFGERYCWTEWHISSGLLRRLVRRSGLQGLFCQHSNSADSGQLFLEAVRRLKNLSIADRWVSYRLFRSVEDAVDFKNLQSVYLAHPDNRGIARTKFDAHLPPSLRYLNISGGWSYQLDRLLQCPCLEELVLEASSSCTFEAPPSSPLVHQHLKRLVLIEHQVVSKLAQILRHVTLPSLQLIQICNAGPSSVEDWRQQYLTQHFARGFAPEFHLSLEHSRLRPRSLTTALANFGGIKIDHLYVDDVDAILENGDVLGHLGHSVHALACQSIPALDKPNIPRALGVLSTLNPKLTLYAPGRAGRLSEEVEETLDVRYISDFALGEMFRHGVQGHQHRRMLDYLLQRRRT